MAPLTAALVALEGGQPSSLLAVLMSALLENLRWKPDYGVSAASAAEDAGSAEGKFGIPRFNGDPNMLQEYNWRIKTKIAKEAEMSKDEIAKLGPLGLRMVEGLRGQAFRLAQQVDISVLSSSAGPQTLLKLFQDNLKPRREQEARELYSAGSREGGLLSRQHGEPMSSYVSRRKAWWSALQGLDAELKIPDIILAEQTLVNCGLSDDQKLMIRTMLQGRVTTDTVAAELLSQHPHIHEKEKRHGSHHGKGHGKWRPQHRSEDAGSDDWETTSQPLAGFTAIVEDEPYVTEYDDALVYAAETQYDQTLEEDDESFLAMNFALLAENGFDMNNDEACALAAETLQLEHEAYLLRGHGKGKGHGGFQAQRQFDISGQVSLQERKARLAQLKAKTECRRCGGRGHWSGDSVCPKGSGKKGSKKSSGGGSTASTKPSGASGGKSGGKPKQRVVYSAQGPTGFGYMAIKKEPKMDDEPTYGRVPPPTSMQSQRSLPSAMASGSNFADQLTAVMTEARGHRLEEEPKTFDVTYEPTTPISSADEEEDHRGVVEEQLPSWLQRPTGSDGTGLALVEHSSSYGDQDDALLSAVLSSQSVHVVQEVLSALEDMQVDEVNGIRRGLSEEQRMLQLDEWLAAHNPDDPRYGEAYHERYNEMVPGHPMFTQMDGYNLARWQQNRSDGIRPELLPLPDMPKTEAAPTEAKPTTKTSSQKTLSVKPPTDRQKSCSHKIISKAGSNQYYLVEKCADCGLVLKREPRNATSSTSPTTSTPGGLTEAQQKCPHPKLSWKGTNGHQWRTTCTQCGLVSHGRYRDGGSSVGSTLKSKMNLYNKPDNPNYAEETTHIISEVEEIFRTCMVIARVKAEEHGAHHLSSDRLHKILEAVRLATAGAPTATGRIPPDDRDEWDQRRLSFGEFKNRTYIDLYNSEKRFVDWCLQQASHGGKMARGLKDFVTYVERKRHNPPWSQTGLGLMALHGKSSENNLIAILDSGCNRTCHGDRWLQRYMQMVDRDQFPLDADEGGGFRGIGGTINTTGVRDMDVCFEIEDGMAVGNFQSVELEGSDAPLLISLADQRRLGFTLTLDGEKGDKIYSARLGAHLVLTEFNGLIGIRLMPSQLALLTQQQHEDLDLEPDFPQQLETSPTSAITEASSTTEAPPYLQQVDEEPPPQQALASLGAGMDLDLPVAQGCQKDDLTQQQVNHVAIEDANRKTLTRGQRKFLEQSVEEITASDTSLWATLKGDRHHTPLPRGCKVFLMEIFAGAAVLTSMAMGCGLSVAAPIDIKLDGSDLLDPKVRAEIEEHIDDLDPYCVTFAPVCGPWGPWSKLNMSKSESTHDNILAQRDAWYPCLQWIRRMVKKRLSRGRKTLVENPWQSELWGTLCMSKLIDEAPEDAESGEPLELVRGDQCAFGLKDAQNGLPHFKPTGFLTASRGIKEQVQLRCDGTHVHQPLEGGQRCKLAQHWPEPLCKAIIHGLLGDLHSRTVMAAFQEAAIEEVEHSDHELGSLDFVYDMNDESRNPVLPDKVDDLELHRQEGLEEAPNPADLMELEVTRKNKWLRADRETRIAIRRLHHMIGHGSSSAMIQLLRNAGASTQAIEAARHFACETCRKREPVKRAPVVKEPSRMIFNYEIAGDCFEIHDAAGNRHTILSVVCMGTLFHQAWWVAGGGVPKSSVCAAAIQDGWFQPFGPPKVFTCDRGVRNRGRLMDLLRINGVYLRYVGVEAPFQIGRTERQGGLLKEVMKSSIEERQIIGVNDIKMLVSECVNVKNGRINHHGFTPAQWVLGRLPHDATSVTAEEAQGYHLGVQAELAEPEDEFARQLEIRQSAKMSFAKVDSSRRIRAALLRKSVPLRGPYAPGDLICFHRKGRWNGPGRIIGREGRSTLWVIHGGIPIVVAESQIRPASAQEVMVKQILELRPGRKRKREVADISEEIPFADDLALPDLPPDDDQRSCLEIPHEPGAEGSGVDAAMAPPPALELPDTEMPMMEAPPGLVAGPDLPQAPSMPASLQPESEHAPTSTAPTMPPTPAPPQLGLQEALRRSVDDLDGHQMRPSHAAARTERSRSPHREAGNIPVPGEAVDEDGALHAERQERHFHAFLAKRMPKKKRQVGAGRELTYKNCTEDIKNALDETRRKEWRNWKQFEAAYVMPPGEAQEKFLAENPDLVVIPSRWVDTDKSGDPTKPEFKSRLVARGDLEKTSVRTDSPTSSQLFLHVIVSFSVSKKRKLRAGDISAAFLQGTKIRRKLALRLPSDGIPDDEVPEGSLLICEKSVYGTCDAPRGFWKDLYETIISCGLREVPNETSAYYLPGPEGEVCGLLGTHVDDLLWCGGPEMDAVMAKVQERYKFRITNAEDSADGMFKFCGRMFQQTDDGVTITCPEVLDRVKATYIEPARRKQRGAAATPSEIGQLRSVVGSLSWYSRVCRPDLSYIRSISCNLCNSPHLWKT